MEIFEYIAVLTSIIIGLGITQLLRGVARLIQHPGRDKVYWVHLVWVVTMFFNMVFWWWWDFRLYDIEAWTCLFYLVVVIYALVVFLACALLSPEDLSDYDGYKGYFYSRRQWFFGLLALSLVIDVGDSWLKGAEHFSNLGLEYAIATSAKLVLFISAAVWSNERFHVGFAIVNLAYTVLWAIRMFETLA